METYVANIPKEAHTLALEDKSNRTVDPAKRPAPMTSGCRIEGFVRVKKVRELAQSCNIFCSILYFVKEVSVVCTINSCNKDEGFFEAIFDFYFLFIRFLGVL